MPGGVVSAVGGILGGRAQERGARRAQESIEQQFEQTREDLAPFREAGVRGLEGFEGQIAQPDIPLGLAEYARGFQQSPGYQYQLQEGQDAIQNAAASRGLLQSGRTLRGLQEHAQGLANQDYYNYVGQNRQGLLDRHNQRQNRIGNFQGLATIGQNAAAQTGTFGQNAANQIANTQVQAGNARASGFQSAAAGINSGLGGLAGFAGFNRGGGFG